METTGSENQVPAAPAGKNGQTGTGRSVPGQEGQPDPGRRTRPKAARVPRTSELVSAGSLFARMIRGYFALSREVDDAERQYGPKVYESMMNDPVVGSCVDVLRQSAIREVKLSPPEEFQPVPGQDMTPEEQKAADICDRCRRALHNPERPLVESLFEWTYGLVEDKLAEVVLDKVFEGPDAGYFTFRAFKFKPRETWLYVVDAWGNVGFVAGRLPPGELPPSPNEAVYVPGTGGNSILLETDRFAVFSWGRRDSDPRCRPILRRAYNAWNLKVRTWPEKLKGDVQFGTPSIAAILPEDAQDPEPDAVSGLTLADGTPVETAEDLALYMLVQIVNGSAGVFPFGTAIQVIESGRDGGTLNQSIDLYNREIATAVLHAARTTLEASGGTRSEGEQKMDVTELLVALIRSMLAGLLRNMLRTLVRLNDGPEAAATMVPQVSLGEYSDQDMPKLITALAKWVQTGAPTQSQMAVIDAMLNLPPRRPGEESLADAAADRAADMAKGEEDGPEEEEEESESPAGKRPADSPDQEDDE